MFGQESALREIGRLGRFFRLAQILRRPEPFSDVAEVSGEHRRPADLDRGDRQFDR